MDESGETASSENAEWRREWGKVRAAEVKDEPRMRTLANVKRSVEYMGEIKKSPRDVSLSRSHS